MKAMILSAGFGKRLQPLTLKYPKPLMKISKGTLLSNTINFIEKFGVNEAIINTHYLGDQIKNYIDNNKFNLNVKIINEEKEILDTGGGVLNAIQNFLNEPFLIINPDTIWNLSYLEELKMLKKDFFLKKNCKCCMLVVDKEKSFDRTIKGDFNLENGFINRNNKDNLKYIYTGLQIIKPEVFSNFGEKKFSINKVWDRLIIKNELLGIESKLQFLHVSTLEIYKILKKKNFKS